MTTESRNPREGGAPGGAHVRAALSAYVDDELPPARAAAVADHLTRCAVCSAAYTAMLDTVGTVREGFTRYAAPDTLRVRVRAALREAVRRDAALHAAAADDAAQDETMRSGPAPNARQSGHLPATASTWRVGRRVWAWAAAASLALAALSSGATLVAARARLDGERVEQQVLASHIRSLMPDHLTDVRSTDQHTVKPWFNGRLDFSPAVVRLDSLGFPLLGGRLDYVGGRPVAVVVYGRRQHVVNVFSWPTGAADAGMSSGASHGYHALHWRAAGVEHWVVSDLNAVELGQFAALLRQAAR